jgi:hypothetical protein
VTFICSCVGEPLKRIDGLFATPARGAMFIAMKSYNGSHSFSCAMLFRLAVKTAFIF